MVKVMPLVALVVTVVVFVLTVVVLASSSSVMSAKEGSGGCGVFNCEDEDQSLTFKEMAENFEETPTRVTLAQAFGIASAVVAGPIGLGHALDIAGVAPKAAVTCALFLHLLASVLLLVLGTVCVVIYAAPDKVVLMGHPVPGSTFKFSDAMSLGFGVYLAGVGAVAHFVMFVLCNCFPSPPPQYNTYMPAPK